jgi:hypothetical protein
MEGMGITRGKLEVTINPVEEESSIPLHQQDTQPLE